MNIQELKDFFAKSDYSSDTKSAIADILVDKQEVTHGLVSHLKDILQKELDADFNELGVDLKNDPEMQKIEKEYTDTLDTIEKDLNSDMEFVESELRELDELKKKITQASDEIDASKIADNLKQ